MNEISWREKTAIYIGGAFVMAIVIWAIVALLRSEGMPDYKSAWYLSPSWRGTWCADVFESIQASDANRISEAPPWTRPRQTASP